MSSWRGVSLAPLVLFTAACPSPLGDAVEDDGGAPEDAAAETLPVLTPCPDGWRQIAAAEQTGGVATCDPWSEADPVARPVIPCADGWRSVPPDAPEDVATCDPFPEGGPAACARDEAHFPGEPSCSRIGTACSDDDWAADLPVDGTVLFVKAGAPDHGSGTRDSPFGSIGQAVTAASAGAVIALSKGTFDERVLLVRRVTLWGACVAETLLTYASASETQGVVTVRATEAVVRNLRVSGGRAGIWVEGGGRTATVQDVVVEQATGAGLLAQPGSTLQARSIVVAETLADSQGQFGRGLQAVGASADVERAVFEGNHDIGVFAAEPDTLVRLVDVVVRNTQPRESDGDSGEGLHVQDGARAEALRALFERNRDIGVLAGGAGSVIELTDVVVRDTQSSQSDETSGRGLDVGYGAQAHVERAVFERNREVGVFATAEGTVLELADSVVRDTEEQASDGTGGWGIGAQSGARARVERVLLVRNRETSVSARGPGTFVEAFDVIVRDTSSRTMDGGFGWALDIEGGARTEVTRALLERNREAAIVVQGEGAVGQLTDVIVRDTSGREADGAYGWGLGVGRGAQCEVQRALFERNADVGVIADGQGTVAHLADVVVRDTRGRRTDGTAGWGLAVGMGAQVDVARALFERNREVGVGTNRPGSRLVLADTLIRDTLERECADEGCAGAGAGIGAGAWDGAALVLERFEIVESALCGLQLAHGLDATGRVSESGGTADLQDGLVARNPVGVNLQVDGFDLTRLQDGVRYEDNGRNFDSSEVPIPVVSTGDLGE